MTIWGESAGSASVFLHMIYNQGDNTYKGTPLFRGAIMDSGTFLPAAAADSDRAQSYFDIFAKDAGCFGANDTAACLRGLDYGTLLSAQASSNIHANTFVPRPDGLIINGRPDDAIRGGRYTAVPFITGNQEDEGTLFALLENLQTPNDTLNLLYETFPDTNRTLVAQLAANYPEDITAGSPFRTGIFNNIYPEYKRYAAITGDYMFIFTRRLFFYLSTASKPSVPSWSYLATYFYGLPIVGSVHGSDIIPAFGILPGVPQYSIQSYYISFVNSLDPNIGTPSNLPIWPQWSTSKQSLNFGAFWNTLIPDNFRATSYNFVSENFVKFTL